MKALSIGNGGWVKVNDAAHERAFVRFDDSRGRLVAVELYLGPPLDATALRRFPIAELERVVNSDPAIARAIRRHLDAPRPLLDEAIDFYAHNWGTRRGELNRPHWAADMYWSQLADTGVARATGAKKEAPIQPSDDTAGSSKLEVPAGRPFPPEFYKAVAEIYQRLVRAGKKPAPIIADVNGVNTTQVHRWVRVARELGFLTPAKQGKAG